MNQSVLLLYILIIGAAFIFMTSRSNKKRQAQQAQMQAALVLGAQVRTIGGLVGEVVEVTDEHVTIETTPGVRLKFVKSAVAGVVAPEDPAAGDEAGDADPAEPADTPERVDGKADGQVDSVAESSVQPVNG